MTHDQKINRLTKLTWSISDFYKNNPMECGKHTFINPGLETAKKEIKKLANDLDLDVCAHCEAQIVIGFDLCKYCRSNEVVFQDYGLDLTDEDMGGDLMPQS